MIPSRIKWSPHNKSEYLVISEYLPYFASFVPTSRSSSYMGFESSMDLSYRNVGLFECQNLKGFNMSTPCNFSIASTKDMPMSGADSGNAPSSSSSAAAASASLPAQQNSSSRSTSPTMTPDTATSPMISSAFDGNPMSEGSIKSYTVTDDGLYISNRGNRPMSSRNLSFALNPGLRVKNICIAFFLKLCYALIFM